MKRRVAVFLLLALAADAAFACGGGGSKFREWMRNTFTVENAYSIAEEVPKTSSALGTAIGIVNGILFTLADFFSEQKNLDDFSAGISAFENLHKGNTEVDHAKVGGGAQGMPSNMTVAEFESLFE